MLFAWDRVQQGQGVPFCVDELFGITLPVMENQKCYGYNLGKTVMEWLVFSKCPVPAQVWLPYPVGSVVGYNPSFAGWGGVCP